MNDERNPDVFIIDPFSYTEPKIRRRKDRRSYSRRWVKWLYKFLQAGGKLKLMQWPDMKAKEDKP